MSISHILDNLTPYPWRLVRSQPDQAGWRIEGSRRPDSPGSPVVCQLEETNHRANGQLLVAAPELLIGLQLALQAIEQPSLRRIALKRGLAMLTQVTGQTAGRPDPGVIQTLKTAGVTEPTLTELSLTTSPAVVDAWVAYAAAHDLGPGFIITQLRAGGLPPAEATSKTWFTADELKLLLT